jgi:DnaJ-class molecular chaperone
MYNKTMDYYSTLGVERNASQDEIKKAYRSLAMKHHPDRGGDESTFKKISEAYDTLSDPKKKEIVDLGGDPNQQGGGFGGNSFNQGPFEFHFGGVPPGMEDLFGRFGGAPFGGRPMRRNKTLNITVDITLLDVLTGKELNAEMSIPGTGKRKMINISIPAGIENGQQIRYEGMGDDSMRDLKPGDLIVNVGVIPHPKFRREHTNLILEHAISAWDAILGTHTNVETLDGKTLTLTIPPGTSHGTILSCRGEGLPVMRSRNRGNLLVTIKIDIPKNLSQLQIEKIKEIKNNI